MDSSASYNQHFTINNPCCRVKAREVDISPTATNVLLLGEGRKDLLVSLNVRHASDPLSTYNRLLTVEAAHTYCSSHAEALAYQNHLHI